MTNNPVAVTARGDGSFAISSPRGLYLVARDRAELEHVRDAIRANRDALDQVERALGQALKGDPA